MPDSLCTSPKLSDQGCLDCDLQPFIEAVGGVYDITLLVDDHECRDAPNSVLPADQGPFIQGKGIMGVEFFLELLHPPKRFADVDPNDDQAFRFILISQVVEIRNFLYAAAAPGRPEDQKYWILTLSL